MADKPFPAYAGDEPYFFVSYAHDDAESVYPEMAWLEPAGFNLWYDDGIHVGSVWRQALADALSASSGLVFFATEHSTSSSNCLQELNFALDEDKPVFVVQLDDHRLPSLLRLSLSDRQALIRGDFEESAYRSRLVSALSTVVPPVVRAASPVAPQSAVKSPTRTDPPSVAVLPLTCLGADQELTYLAQGLSGDLIAGLSQRVWHIIAGTPQDAALDPGDIGARRNVRYVLGGTVQRGGSRVRLTVRLTRCSDAEQIWSARYERTGEDLLDIQDQLVHSVIFDLFDPVIRSEAARLRDVPVEEVDAWGLCALARRPIVDRESRDAARKLLEMAVDRDPQFAYAHSTYAWVLGMLVWSQFTRTPDEDAQLAVVEADLALSLAPNDIVSLAQASQIHRMFGDPHHAVELARRAADIGGMPTPALFDSLLNVGRLEEAMDIVREHNGAAVEFSAVIACLGLGLHEEALEWARRGTGRNPSAYLQWAALAAAQAALGNPEQAADAWGRARALLPTLTVDRYEKGYLISMRDAALVEPLIAPLRAVGLE